MFNKSLAVAALLGHVTASKQDHWAVLVAGSNQYYNYRHQSDTCHAYQIMKANGIPEDHIIHVAYDDIANSPSNPFPGKIFNKPTAAGTPGVDVYDGCKIDYSKSEATAANVLAILKGDKSAAKGPVLGSDENSKVFFYFADHGAPGLVAMPVGPYLYAKDFNNALTYMHENKMYKEMTVYIEACESGSMFENLLPDNINIYGVSASDSHQSSWASYCSPDDKVDGKSVGSCLGDLFSTNWMEDTDANKVNVETLQTQYETVKEETSKSPVLQWGQLSLTSEPIGDFQGTVDEAKKLDFWHTLKNQGKKFLKEATSWNEAKSARKNQFAVDSRDVKLHYLYNRVMTDATPEAHAELKAEVDHRMKVDETFAKIFPGYSTAEKVIPSDYECYKELVEHFEGACFKFDDYSMKYMGSLVQQCEAMKVFPEAKQSVKDKMAEVCTAKTA